MRYARAARATLLSLWLAACASEPKGCLLPNEVQGADGRTVFGVSSPLSYEAGWPLATGDQFDLTGKSSGDAQLLTARSSNPAALSVLKQGTRLVTCGAQQPCDPADSQARALDSWTLLTHAEGEAEVRLEEPNGALHDRTSLIVARVALVDLVKREELLPVDGAESPLGEKVEVGLNELLTVGVRARAADGRRVAVACSPRMTVADPGLVDVQSLLANAADCQTGGAGTPGPMFVFRGIARGPTQIRLTLGDLEVSHRIVVE